jgi:hypothetical protein
MTGQPSSTQPAGSQVLDTSTPQAVPAAQATQNAATAGEDPIAENLNRLLLYEPQELGGACAQVGCTSSQSIGPTDPTLVTIPQPTQNETWTQYQQDLTAAGITHTQDNPITDINQVDMTKPADAVVTVTPAAGIGVNPDTQTVTVTSNPDKMPVVIPAPTGGGEAATDYANTLTSLGLVPQIQEQAINFDDQVEGAVADVSDEPGTRAWPGTDETVFSVPPPTAYNEDPSCRVSAPSNADPGLSRGVNWNPLGDATTRNRYQPYDGSQGDDQLAAKNVGLERNTGTGTMVPVNFLWGWTYYSSDRNDWPGWGYRHIKAKHGWSDEDRAETQLALEQAPWSTRNGKITYVGPEYLGQNATQCWRIVVVLPTAAILKDANLTFPEPTARGIITSYGASTLPPQ